MKKYLIYLLYSLFLIVTSCANNNYPQQSMDNVQKRLNWAGVYEGYFPGNSSLVQIQLNEDNTYNLISSKKGRLKLSLENSGKIFFSDDKRVVSLFGYSKPIEFYVYENELHLKTFGQKSFDRNFIIFKQIKFY